MGRVKEMLFDRPFSAEQESVYNLARRMKGGVELELMASDLANDKERDLVRLKTACEEIIEYENTDSRVQQS